MHLHGTDFRVVAKDGHPVPETAQYGNDVIRAVTGLALAGGDPSRNAPSMTMPSGSMP